MPDELLPRVREVARRFLPLTIALQSIEFFGDHVYEPKALDKQRMRETIGDQLALPQQFRVESVAYFKRILPREYRAEEI